MENIPTIVAPGAIISFGAGSASVAIPPDGSGKIPNYCRIVSTQPCYVRFGQASPVAVAGDLMIQPADSMIIRTAGFLNVAAIQVSVAGVFQISPLENV